jgi:hypothetical protein
MKEGKKEARKEAKKERRNKYKRGKEIKRKHAGASK